MNGLTAFASLLGLLFILIRAFLVILVLYLVIVKGVKKGMLQAWDQIEKERAQNQEPPPEPFPYSDPNEATDSTTPPEE